LGIDKPFIVQSVAVGIGRTFSTEPNGRTGGRADLHDLLSSASVDDCDGRMIGLGEWLHAPIEPRAKIVLQICRPAAQRIVAISGALPGIELISAVVIASRKIRVQPVASR